MNTLGRSVMCSDTRRRCVWLCSVIVGVACLAIQPVAQAQQQPLERLAAIDADRDNVIYRLASQWSGQADESTDVLVATFSGLTSEQLLAIQDADNMDQIKLIVSGQEPGDTTYLTALTNPSPEPLTLGDLDKDFVYTPVSPCRIVDTRLTAAGPIPANTVHAASWSMVVWSVKAATPPAVRHPAVSRVRRTSM